jgi:hypothetical protein
MSPRRAFQKAGAVPNKLLAFPTPRMSWLNVYNGNDEKGHKVATTWTRVTYILAVSKRFKCATSFSPTISPNETDEYSFIA